MNAAVLGGLVEQWVWRCQMIVTQYQLRQPIDLKAEVEKLVGQAEAQARRLDGTGAAFLAKLENRLDLRAHIAELPEPLAPGKLTDPVLNAAGRAEALHALAEAFGHAAQRLKSVA
jgi:hypothetical protein